MSPTEPLRVVILSNDPISVVLLHQVITAAGHVTAGVIMPRPRNLAGWRLRSLGMAVTQAPADLDVCVVPRSSRIAPLLRAYQPDLAACMYFPWLVPGEALAVPRLGVINGHPSLLPRYRGPMPAAWALRNGDREIGVTVHRMDEDFDTGPMLAQAGMEIAEDIPLGEVQEVYQKCAVRAFVGAFKRLAAGSLGAPQPAEGVSHAGPFSAEDAWLDLSRPAREVHNLVRGWTFVSKHDGERGPLVEISGGWHRVHHTALTEPATPATRIDCADGPLWVIASEPVNDLSAANDPRQLARAA
jgi:methionyl-tRNA formyltransferase